MKLKLTLILAIAAKMTFGQCLDNGITTNPAAPVNNQLPSQRNLYFDWRQQNFQSNSTCQPLTLVESPFFKVDNLEILRQSKDMLPEDGWELIRRDLGYTDQNTIKPEVPEHTYFILYNKYTGVLRILLKTCRAADYNGMKVSIKFDATTIFQTALLDLAVGTKALDSTHTKNPSAQSASVFVNDRTKWFYADFPMNYDPCTCKYKSKLNIISQLIQNSTITLQGSITGTVTTIANGQGAVNNSGSYSFKDFVNDADKFKKGYASVDNFITETKNVVTTIPNSASTVAALNTFQTELKNLQFLKTGLAAVPWLKAAVGVLDFFTGGGKTSPQTVQIMPMAVNLGVKLSGTMQTSNQYHNLTFTNPGALDAQTDPAIYPFYNEVLGVFNLLNTPVFKKTIAVVREGSPREGFTFRTTITRQLKSPIKWVLNPSSGLTLQDGQVAFVTLGDSSVTPPASIEAGFNFLEGKDADSRLWQYRTEYVPINCLGNNFSFAYTFRGFQKPIWLKFILNFKRNNNPAAQNILLVLKFPTKDEAVSETLTTATFNPTSCVGGYLSQATSTEVNTFCTSTQYTTNRLMRAAPVMNNNLDIIENKLMISPNPANDFITLTGTILSKKLTQVEIIDMVGSTRLKYKEQQDGAINKSYYVGSLSNGMYVLKLHYSNGEISTSKFLIAK